MPKGKTPVALRLSTLNKLVNYDMQAPELFFLSLFGNADYPSDTIEWESQVGNMGLTPFVAPGSVSPALAPSGIGTHSARCATWKEKMYMDEEWLNNMRQPGTRDVYDTAERKMTRELYKMKNRCVRRREWMVAQMMMGGTITYLTTGETKFTVSYGVPTEHMVTLAGDARWVNGASPDIAGDCFDAQEVVSDATGQDITDMVINSKTLRTMMEDTTIQALLKKSAFGNGDLFRNPRRVIGELIGIGNIHVYNDRYKVYAWITGISGTTITVDEVSDFAAGMSVTFMNMKDGTYEVETIASVDSLNSTITVASAPSATFVAGRDRVVAVSKFVSDDKCLFFTRSVDGLPIAEFMQSPFGLDRHYGQKVDSREEWDPDGVWLRVQDKGLPILYRRDALYVLDHQ